VVVVVVVDVVAAVVVEAADTCSTRAFFDVVGFADLPRFIGVGFIMIVPCSKPLSFVNYIKTKNYFLK